MSISLDMIGIVATNLDESLRFYKLLGVDTPTRNEGDDHVEARLANGLRLAWDSLELIRQLEPNWQEPVGQRMGLAFLCEKAEDVDATHARLVEAGYKSHKEPWDAFWGQRYAQVYDPDGNIVDMFAWQRGKE